MKPQRTGRRELKQKQRKRQEKKQLTDTAEWNEGVKEKSVSVPAAQLRLRKRETREQGTVRAGEREQHKPSV